VSRFVLATKHSLWTLAGNTFKFEFFGRRRGTWYMYVRVTSYLVRFKITNHGYEEDASFHTSHACVGTWLLAATSKKSNIEQQPTMRMATSTTVSNDEQLTMNNINQLLNVTFTTLLREKRYVLVAGTQAAMCRENGVGA